MCSFNLYRDRKPTEYYLYSSIRIQLGQVQGKAWHNVYSCSFSVTVAMDQARIDKLFVRFKKAIEMEEI